MPPSRNSVFSGLIPAPADEPFTLNAAYLSDPSPRKINLGIGVYRTDTGESWPLPSIEKSEKKRAECQESSRHDYLPIQGDLEFLSLARDIVFGGGPGGKSPPCVDAASITSVQTLSGTGANHLGAKFLARHDRVRNVWIPEPTWSNHHVIWELVGIEKKTYPYFDREKSEFTFERMMQSLEDMAMPGDVLLLHACAHNPTGADPTKSQWRTIADICEKKQLFPFFDLAYQGFASGDLDEDAWAIRYFATCKPEAELCVAQSFSKNFGLYGQRVGALHIVHGGGRRSSIQATILSNLCHLIRGEFSMAPRNGSDLVKQVLQDSSLREQWVRDLQSMSDRMKVLRRALFAKLRQLGTPGTWDHITRQIGMFSYTGLSAEQVETMRIDHHIYMLKSGRISISGLNNKNVGRVAWAIDDVVRRLGLK